LNLEVGCDQGKFRSYYLKTIASEAYKRDVGENDGSVELEYVAADPSHLILWKDGEQILGHAIWHESNTDEHRPGVPREEDDKRLLRELLGGRADFIELHELWLPPEHRGKGYGRQFFDFFESSVSSKGHNIMVHHTFDETVAGICRRRGYKEIGGATVAGKPGWIFSLSSGKTPFSH
jgi:GNAT superfamily N-acetyltransferase